MTREELKAHCLRQVEGCEMWAKCKGEEPHGRIYEEHKLILELLEQEESVIDKVKQAREEMKECSYSVENEIVVDLYNVLIILNKLIESGDKKTGK